MTRILLQQHQTASVGDQLIRLQARVSGLQQEIAAARRSQSLIQLLQAMRRFAGAGAMAPEQAELVRAHDGVSGNPV